MQVKCEYCGSLIPDDVEKCPNCGATNVNMQRAVKGTPKTIAELEQWYKDRGLPPYNVTRFFIGIDCKEPKAFGIYKDGDQFVVYKNKSNGERAERYRGTDEDYAVNELYLKLKSEIIDQKARNQQKRSAGQTARTTRRNTRTGCLPVLFVLAIIFVIVCILFAIFHRDTTTYYSYNGVPYVFYNNNYYAYDYDTNDYDLVNDYDVPDDISSYEVNHNSDNIPEFNDSSSNSSSWSDSSWYDSDDDYSYDWDSNDSWDSDWDSDWDSGGWDSGSSWDSDW